MDVVVMLKKMRQDITEFKMEIEAEKTTEHPIHFKSAELVYLMSGPVEPEKVIKAVESSLTKYCGVNYMISKTCAITFKILLNGSVIKLGPVNFIEPK
jgi:putative redox protein